MRKRLRATVVFLACFASSSHGRRVQPGKRSQGAFSSEYNSVDSPETAFVLPGIRVQSAASDSTHAKVGTSTTHARRHPVMAVQVTEEPVQSASEQRQAAHALTLKKTDMLLRLVDTEWDLLNLVNKVTAVHRLAAMNRRDLTAQTRLLIDPRFERLLVSTAESAHELDARGIADVMWACGSLHHWPTWMFKPFLFAVNAALDAGTFRAYQVPRIVFALSQLQTKPVRILERLEEHLVSQLDEFDMNDCSKLLTGYKKLNYQPHGDVMRHIQDALLSRPEVMNETTAVQASAVLTAAPLVVTPGEWDELLVEIGKQVDNMPMENFTAHNLANFVSAYAELNLAERLPDGLVDKWVDALQYKHQIEGHFVLAAENELEAALNKLGRRSAWVKGSIMINLWYEAFQEVNRFEAEDRLKQAARQGWRGEDVWEEETQHGQEADSAEAQSRYRRLLRWRCNREGLYNAEEVYKVYKDMVSPVHGYIDVDCLTAALEENNLPSDLETVEGMMELANWNRGLVDYHNFRLVLHDFAGEDLPMSAKTFRSARAERRYDYAW